MLLINFLENSAELLPDKVAIKCRGQSSTYREIHAASNSFSHTILEAGFSRHDRAIIFLDNSIESVVALFAIVKAGGVFVIVSPQVKPRKLRYIMEDCQATLLITDLDNLGKITEAISSLLDLKVIIPIDHDMTTPKIDLPKRLKLISYSHVIKNVPLQYIKERCIDVDLVSLIYTSGSSGNPKGVMLTHHNMVSAADSIIQYLENTRDDIIMDALPLAFDYGLYQILMSFRFGGTVILEKGFTYPQQIIDLVIREKVTGWPLVPTMAAILIRLKNLAKLDFSNLRYITTTGQLFPPKHILQIRKLFPEVKFFSMYGLTECKRVSYIDPEKLDGRLNSVGKPMPNVEAYIVDNKGREITEAKKPGELVVRGSNVMQGYWKLPQDTRRVLCPGTYPGEKVLYTGDIFEKDDEGYLYFLSRKDDIIKTAGFMVSPKEVENVLYEMEDVVGAAVIGVDDSILGKAIKAFIQLKDASNITEEDILSFCSERLEQYSVPKYIKICQKLPLTETGKISKRNLA